MTRRSILGAASGSGISPVNGLVSLQGKIVDSAQQPIPFASVTIVDQNGNYKGDGVAADEFGTWYLTSTLFNGNLVQVSSVGFKTVRLNPETLYPTSLIQLTKNSETLPEVVVTPKNNDKKPLYIGLAVLAVLLLLKR